MKSKLLLLLLIVVITCSCGYMNKQEVTTKVTDKERITTKESSYYLVFTEKGEYKIQDQLFFGKFNSSSIYSKIKKDSTYTFVTYGFRIPLLSEYPNIRKVRSYTPFKPVMGSKVTPKSNI